MRRRGLTVLLGAVLTVLLGIQIGRTDVPYVALSPGPTVDTLGAVDRDGEACKNPSVASPVPSGASPAPEPECQEVIQITGTQVSTGKGQLRMVTVSIQSSMSLIDAIRGWFADDEAVLPRKLIYQDRTDEQVEQESKQEFEQSQTSAETIALRKLGYPVSVTVTEVTPDGASVGKLEKGDVIESVDGVQVTSRQKLIELIQAKGVGKTLQIGYSRNGAKATVPITTKAGPDNRTPRIGVSAESVQPHPFELKIKLDKIGGPSAGMMFALAIIDKLSPEDLTHGVIIAGTGEIDEEGNVGIIGGITQKLYGARAAGATIFLTPAGNCEEAKRNIPAGLRLVKVSTLDDALAALNALPDGQGLPSC